MSKECLIESLQKTVGVDFVSIKRKPGVDELVLNPNCFEEVDWGMQLLTDRRVDRRAIEILCGICGACNFEVNYDDSTEFEGRRGLRVSRKNYGQEIVERPLYNKEVFHFSDEDTPSGKRYRVCVVDDFSLGFEWVFENSNTDLMEIIVDANVRPSEISSRALINEVIDWHPDCLVSDKGLGYVDGIELIKAAKATGIWMVMLTGEIQTNETRRVADVFLTKPASGEEIRKNVRRRERD